MLRNRFSMLAGMILCAFSIGAARAQQNVVPGQSLGKVTLGMRYRAVLQALGTPNQTQNRGHYNVLSWTGAGSRSSHELSVVLREGRVVQIQANSPDFATTGGVSVRSRFSELRRRYPRMHASVYGFAEDGGGGYQTFYMDSVARGIAFTQGTQDDESTYISLPTSKPETLIVHLPGVRAIPTSWEPGVTIGHATADYLPSIQAWLNGGPHRKLGAGA